MARIIMGVRRRLGFDRSYLVQDDFGGFLLDDGGRLLL